MPLLPALRWSGMHRESLLSSPARPVTSHLLWKILHGPFVLS